jgi:hypothetical protein
MTSFCDHGNEPSIFGKQDMSSIAEWLSDVNGMSWSQFTESEVVFKSAQIILSAAMPIPLITNIPAD